MKNITVVSEDRVGLLADISYILGKNSVNIDSLNVDIIGEKAVISLLVKDHRRARDVLGKNGYKIAEADAVVIKVSNKIGALNEVMDMLSKEKVSVENLSMLSTNLDEGVFALQVDKPRKATRLLDRFLVTPTP